MTCHAHTHTHTHTRSVEEMDEEEEEASTPQVTTHTHTQRERVCVSERACFALEKESGCKRGRVLLEGEKEREEKVRGERARKNRSFLNALVAVL